MYVAYRGRAEDREQRSKDCLFLTNKVNEIKTKTCSRLCLCTVHGTCWMSQPRRVSIQLSVSPQEPNISVRI